MMDDKNKTTLIIQSFICKMTLTCFCPLVKVMEVSCHRECFSISRGLEEEVRGRCPETAFVSMAV